MRTEIFVHDKGMARGLPVTNTLPVEVMAVLMDVSPAYYASRYLVSTREAKVGLGCSLHDLKVLCGAGRLRFHTNANGTIYLTPEPYQQLVEDLQNGRCTIAGLLHEIMLESANRIGRALLDDPIESEGFSDAY